MGWKITRDYLFEDDPRPEFGAVSRVGYGEDHTRIPWPAAVAGMQSEPLPTVDDNGNDLPTVEFRMYDDDGNLYYEGWLHDDDECLNQSSALAYGEGDAGCTRIEVLRDEWKMEIG